MYIVRSMDRIAIYGAGALAKQIINYNLRYNMFEVVALIDDNAQENQTFMGYDVLPFDRFSIEWPMVAMGGVVKVTVSIGYVKCNSYRKTAVEKVVTAGYPLYNFIAPGANVWPGSIKEDDNILVFDNAFVGVGCHLERGVIISEGTVLSHDITVGEYTFMSDGVVVGGHCHIGQHSFVGLNSTIKSNTTLGKYNIVGCAANVLKDTPDYSVVKGNPGIVEQKDTLNVEI